MALQAEISRSGATLHIQAHHGSGAPKATAAGSLRFDGSLLHEIDPDLVFEISIFRSGSIPGSSDKEPC